MSGRDAPWDAEATRFALEWDGSARGVYVLGVDPAGATTLFATATGRLEGFGLERDGERSTALAEDVAAALSGGDLTLRGRGTLDGVPLDLFLLAPATQSEAAIVDICFWPDQVHAGREPPDRERWIQRLFELGVQLGRAAGAACVVVAGESFGSLDDAHVVLWSRDARG